MTTVWIGFALFVAVLLFIDLFVLNREDHVPSTREALGQTALWVTIGLGFSGFVYLAYGNGWLAYTDPNITTPRGAVINYVTGYLVEFSLSMDNVFVIAVIFDYFRVPAKYQHRVLFWGILGAIFFRLAMILAGVYLLDQFDWMFYVFGALLLYSAYKMVGEGDEVHPSENPIIRFTKRLVPVTKDYHGHNFWISRAGVTAATPLFVALVMVETTDVIFAIDSIPAILGITTDSFLVFSSNILAVLGLRALYFVLSSMIDKFRYLKYSLALILTFVGIKLMLHQIWHPPEWVSLVIIFVTLAGGIAVSLMRKTPPEPLEDPTEIEPTAEVPDEHRL